MAHDFPVSPWMCQCGLDCTQSPPTAPKPLSSSGSISLDACLPAHTTAEVQARPGPPVCWPCSCGLDPCLGWFPGLWSQMGLCIFPEPLCNHIFLHLLAYYPFHLLGIQHYVDSNTTRYSFISFITRQGNISPSSSHLPEHSLYTDVKTPITGTMRISTFGTVNFQKQ